MNGEVCAREGVSVDLEFRLGAQRALDMCEQAGGPEEIAACILQDPVPVRREPHLRREHSVAPSRRGNVFVDLLLRHGYRVIPASEFDPSMLEYRNHHKGTAPLWWFGLELEGVAVGVGSLDGGGDFFVGEGLGVSCFHCWLRARIRTGLGYLPR